MSLRAVRRVLCTVRCALGTGRGARYAVVRCAMHMCVVIDIMLYTGDPPCKFVIGIIEGSDVQQFTLLCTRDGAIEPVPMEMVSGTDQENASAPTESE